MDVENDDCNRCNCKKTKCQNLVGYCNCFSAGKYCAENCSCQDCFNRPEYEKMVIGSRQLIEFWDPHAFIPKITQHKTEASTGSMAGSVSSSVTLEGGFIVHEVKVQFYEDKRSNRNINEELRPPSPKQIRLEKLDAEDNGHYKHCNCMKFTCLKLDCDCFAAGVDCAEACACQECFNRPESFDIINDSWRQIESRNCHACAPKITQYARRNPHRNHDSCGLFLPDTEPTQLALCSTLHATETTTKRNMVGLLRGKGSNSNISGDLQQSSPTRKRLEIIDVEDNDDREGCNCKKNKCLKLDCDCFAAGVDCDEACACQECFNRPNSDGTINVVRAVRRQIEYRNRHACAPKITQYARRNPPRNNVSCGLFLPNTEPHTEPAQPAHCSTLQATETSTKRNMQDGIVSSSARHKRGCNCTKSRFLKDYTRLQLHEVKVLKRVPQASAIWLLSLL